MLPSGGVPRKPRRPDEIAAMLFPSPAAGFDDPLAVLAGCHGRIAAFCDTLERLHEYLRAAGADAEAREAARRVCAYFDEAAPHHHADEEVDLLPLLARRAGTSADRARVGAWEQRIGAEHLAQDKLWRSLRRELQAVIAGHTAELPLVAGFVALEREHYRFEDAEIFPFAQSLLGAADLTMLGRAMARRRGVAGP